MPETTTIPGLKPCPFCGGEACVAPPEGEYLKGMRHSIEVVCSGCRAGVGEYPVAAFDDDGMEQRHVAAEKWNTRDGDHPFDPAEFGFEKWPGNGWHKRAKEVAGYPSESWQIICDERDDYLTWIAFQRGDGPWDQLYIGHWPNSAASARIILQHLGVEGV